MTTKGKKLQKLPGKEAGFIFFWIDSGTHEEIDLLGPFWPPSVEDDEIKFKWQIEEFFKAYQKVTGVILQAKHVIASVPSSGSIYWGPRDQKRYKIYWNPWAVNKCNEATAAMLEKLLG